MGIIYIYAILGLTCFLVYFSGWMASWTDGRSDNNAISAFNKVEVEVKADLGNKIKLQY